MLKLAYAAAAIMAASSAAAQDAVFVDHQAIRACYARAQFILTNNSGDILVSQRALFARKTDAGWRVSGDVLVKRASQDGVFQLNCVVTDDGVDVWLHSDVRERGDN